MNHISLAVREEWQAALFMIVVAVLAGAYMLNHARQSDLAVRAYLECPPEYGAVYSESSRSGIRCVRYHTLVLKGDPAMSATTTDTRFASIDIEVVTMTDLALKVTTDRDEQGWIPFSAIEDEEEARELQIGEVAEISVEEQLAMIKGLI